MSKRDVIFLVAIFLMGFFMGWFAAGELYWKPGIKKLNEAWVNEFQEIYRRNQFLLRP